MKEKVAPPPYVRRWLYARGVSQPLSDNTPSALEIELCPECESSRITLIGSVGRAIAGYEGQKQVILPETQLGRCEDCGSSLRRTVDAEAGPAVWQATGF